MVLLFLPSTCCAICNNAPESADHLLISCSFASEVWHQIMQWCMRSVDRILGSKEYKKMTVCIISSTLWFLWKAMNDRIFCNRIKSTNNTVEEIKATLSIG
ncbi:hypothetical protein R6Q59_026664 [Mikania micrantha]